MPPEKILLSPGPPIVSRVLVTLLAVPMLPIASLITFLAWRDMGAPIGVVLLGCCAVILYSLVRMHRGRSWLEGTVVVQQRLIGNRRCDLRTAEVRSDVVSPGPLVPALPCLIVGEKGRDLIRVWLRDPARGQALLPPDRLRALAHALTEGRGEDQRVRRIADSLLAKADAPFGGEF